MTIHIPLPPATSTDAAATAHFVTAIKDLEALYNSSPYFTTYVDVHLALSPLSSNSRSSSGGPSGSGSGTTEGGRQFNVWRNVARLFARTEFVMMLDVDFAVCTDWRSVVRNAVRRAVGLDVSSAPADGEKGLSEDVVQKLRDGTAALVVPVFEYVKQEDGEDQTTFPRDKAVCLSDASILSLSE